MTVTVRHGDSRDVLATLDENSLDACVTDPPYALESIVKRFGKEGAAPATGAAFKRVGRGFLGQKWDTGDTAFDPEFWRLVYRALKPGAHLLAFGGTRTYHRLACAIEDAGFDIRDMFSWLYGSGFPKNHDLAKAIDKVETGVTRGGGGAPIRKGNSFGQEYERRPKGEPISDLAKQWEGWGSAVKPAQEPICFARKPLSEPSIAANVRRWGTGAINIASARIPRPDGVLRMEYFETGARHGYSGGIMGGKAKEERGDSGYPANVQHDGSPEVIGAFPDPAIARFFYSAKADTADRHGSEHPTVKPVDLMRHYVALVTPPGGIVLDPFAGSGSTGIAALGLGLDCLLIEREAAYVADIERRLAWARGDGRMTALEQARDLDPEKAQGHDLPLFGGAV